MARPAPEPSRPTSLTQWLRGRSDAQLELLLRRRPDLGLPAPSDFATLASRISVRSSVHRAVDSLDAWQLRVLEALALTSTDSEIDFAAARDLLPDVDLDPTMTALAELAMIWGEPELRLVAGVQDALGPYPAGLGRSAAVLLRSQTAADDLIARLPSELGQLDDGERDVLNRLAAGPPVGLVRDAQAAPDPAHESAAVRLLARGLLVAIDLRTVELPREVGLAIRGERPLATVATAAPVIEAVVRSPADADREGTAAVLELLRLVEALAESWSRHPAVVLRGGGIGVRELRRTAREINLDEAEAALIIEVAFAAGLVASTNGIDPSYLPTSDYDTWRRREPAQRWVPLGAAWLAMSRQPGLIGQRDERDRVINALGPEPERGTIAGLRRTVLGVLASMPPGSRPVAPSAVLQRLAWTAPRRAAAQRALAEQLLAEADRIGVTSAGGMTSYGRALLAGATTATEDALTIALPAPVDDFLVQPDLTIVVPGPPTPELAHELELVADLESSGGASVYRISEASVRRALDAGRTAVDLSTLFATRSRTPVPQALTYLIDDAARRHGVLRTGAASAYLRCDDESLLDRVLADRGVDSLGLRRLAPTVVISSATVNRLLDVLREAGYAPAAEAPDGAVVTLTVDAPRAASRQTSRLVRPRPAGDPATQTIELVRRIRAGDTLNEIAKRSNPVGQSIPGITSATTLGLLREAIRGEQRIWLGFVDAEGTGSQHTIVPISLAGGVLRGHAPDSPRLQSYPLHRITAVSVVADDD